MLGLPASTEIHKLITKKRIFEHFGAEMSAERRKSFDADIARMVLTNEVSSISVNLPVGESVRNFFVLHITLKTKDFDRQNISYISRLFGQRLIMVLESDDCRRLALWQSKLIMTEWTTPDTLTISINGLDLDKVWENIVTRIAGIEIEQGCSLDEQLALAEQRVKLRKEIERLEKQAWAERQPKKKFELVQQINAQQRKLEELA